MSRPTLYSLASILAALLLQAVILLGFTKEINPLGHDFYAFWSAGRTALEQGFAAPYNPALLKAVQLREMALEPTYMNYWLYPPLLLYWIAISLATLPYTIALCLFIIGNIALWLLVMRREPVIHLLGFPAFLICLLNGQSGVIAACLIIGGLINIKSKPWLAGVFFGLLAFKPQLCFAIPFVLLITREWRVILSGGLTLIVTAPLLGLAPWFAFYEALTLAQAVNSGGVELWKSASLRNGLLYLGLNSPQYIYAFVASLILIGLYRIWKTNDENAKSASLILATLLIAPHVMDYDYVMTAFVVFQYRDRPIMWILWLAPWIARPFMEYTHIPLLYLVNLIAFCFIYAETHVNKRYC